MYIYKNEFCELISPIRESFFETLKTISPEKAVKIKIDGTDEIKNVRISELNNYSNVRNSIN